MKLFSDPETYTLVERDVLYMWMADRVVSIHQNFLLAHARDEELARHQRDIARPPLSKLASSLWCTTATDPRDMMYGLLNICHEAGQPGLTPAYSLLPEETYLQSSRTWICLC